MEPEAADRAHSLIDGFRTTQCVRVAAELRIPHLVSEGPRTAADLAVETGVLEDPLRRVLRTLVSVGVFEETEDAPGPSADVLRPTRTSAERCSICRGSRIEQTTPQRR